MIFFQNVPQGEALLVSQIFFEFEDGKTSKTYKESVKNGPKMQNFNFGGIFDPFGFILRKSGISALEREFYQLSFAKNRIKKYYVVQKLLKNE